MIRALLHPVGLATDALRDLADRAAAATIRTRVRIAQLANAGAFGAYKSPAPKALQECPFVDTVGHEPGDFVQPLRCLDSFLG